MRTGYRMGDATVYDGMYRDGFLDPLCGLIMGETAENLARRYEISREEQDEFALRSQQKAGRGRGTAGQGDRADRGRRPQEGSRRSSNATSIPAPTPRSRRSPS